MILTGKQKRFLRSQANTLPAFFQIGKEGLSESLYLTIDAALEAHELVKISQLKTCTLDQEVIADAIGAATKSQLVQIIGHTFIFYRPSKKNIYELPKG